MSWDRLKVLQYEQYMKITFVPPTDGQEHHFCFHCHAEGVEIVYDADGHMQFHCATCGQTLPRCIYFSSATYWLDGSRTLWHETGGFFVRRPDGRFLFFERDNWPLGFHIPCGHIDAGESGEQGALRELREEVGIVPEAYQLIDVFDLIGDSCSGGADDHRWHLYLAKVNEYADIGVKEEGSNLQWLTLNEALQRPLLDSMRTLIQRYHVALESV